jgi:hypothetical protein
MHKRDKVHSESLSSWVAKKTKTPALAGGGRANMGSQEDKDTGAGWRGPCNFRPAVYSEAVDEKHSRA